jgi:hypothetical protein
MKIDPRIRIRIHTKMSWIRNTVQNNTFLRFYLFFVGYFCHTGLLLLIDLSNLPYCLTYNIEMYVAVLSDLSYFSVSNLQDIGLRLLLTVCR